jgi:hypothetical protein
MAPPAVTETAPSETDGMTPIRRELFRHIVDLMNATQNFARATEESARATRLLRDDIAELRREAWARRAPKRGRRREATFAVATGPAHLTLVKMAVIKGGPSEKLRGRIRVGEPARRSTRAAVSVPPQA